jgi:hypothetical protein
MNKTEQLLTIIEKCLGIIEQEEWGVEIESIEIDPKLLNKLSNHDEEEIEEEREEVTENVKDYSPKSLKEENEHLKNLIDLICDTFWFEKYITDSWVLWVAWDKWLLEEIAKARKIINK